MPDDVKPPRGRPGQPGNVPANAFRGSGNPGGRPRGLEKMTREEIEAFTWEDEELGTLTGWKALRRRMWLVAMHGEAKDAVPAAKFLHDRAYGQAKQSMVIEEAPPEETTVDWSKVPLEEREQLLAAWDRIRLLTEDAGTTEH